MKERSYTLSEVSAHCELDDCWIVINDSVYNVTRFLQEHPGGRDVILEHAGRDATIAFYGSGHSPHGFSLLQEFRIGTLAKHEHVNLFGRSSLMVPEKTRNDDQTLWPELQIMAVD